MATKNTPKQSKISIRKNIFKTLILIILSGILLFVFLLVGLNLYTRHNQSIAVPELKGLREPEVAELVESLGLRYEVVDSVYKERGKPGSILEQVPKAGTLIKSGRTVFLTIQAKGQRTVAIPDLTDFSKRQALSLLQGLGFQKVDVVVVPSQFNDLVVSVRANGRNITKGVRLPIDSPIQLLVGSGTMEIVPDSTSSELEEVITDEQNPDGFL